MHISSAPFLFKATETENTPLGIQRSTLLWLLLDLSSYTVHVPKPELRGGLLTTTSGRVRLSFRPDSACFFLFRLGFLFYISITWFPATHERYALLSLKYRVTYRKSLASTAPKSSVILNRLKPIGWQLYEHMYVDVQNISMQTDWWLMDYPDYNRVSVQFIKFVQLSNAHRCCLVYIVNSQRFEVCLKNWRLWLDVAVMEKRFSDKMKPWTVTLFFLVFDWVPWIRSRKFKSGWSLVSQAVHFDFRTLSVSLDSDT